MKKRENRILEKIIEGKKGIALIWMVLIPLIIFAVVLVAYFVFSATAAGTLKNAITYMKNLFSFGG